LDLPLVFKEQKALQHHYLYWLRGFQVVPGKIFSNPYYQLKGCASNLPIEPFLLCSPQLQKPSVLQRKANFKDQLPTSLE
jgi:hypothetical protein